MPLTILFSRVLTIECFQLGNDRRNFLTVLSPITRAHAARTLGDEHSKMQVGTRHELISPRRAHITQLLPEIKENCDRKQIP